MNLLWGQESETLCRKGGTSRSDNAPHASGARVGAKLALWCHPFCDTAICVARVVTKFACGSSHDHYARTTFALSARYLFRGIICKVAHFVATSFIANSETTESAPRGNR